MFNPSNPFQRGNIRNLRIERSVRVVYDNDIHECDIHPKQKGWLDEQLLYAPCVILSDGAALIRNRKRAEGAQAPQRADEGVVCEVVYALVGELEERLIHIGDTSGQKAAHKLAQHLAFEAGFYSRAFEISAAHLTGKAHQYLAELARRGDASRFAFFAAFHIPQRPAIGVQLLHTPWTNNNLFARFGLSANALLQAHLTAGMPRDLADVLQRAALADVRFLIFDDEARTLEGLPVYERAA
jgi:hypothetical protein